MISSMALFCYNNLLKVTQPWHKCDFIVLILARRLHYYLCDNLKLMIAPDISRIERAKEGRRIQLIKWEEYDRNYKPEFNEKPKGRGQRRVIFGQEIMFLEAAARGDIAEGRNFMLSSI